MPQLTNAGLVAMGGYLPAKPVPENKVDALVSFLRKETLLYHEYVDEIAQTGCLPGRIETNYDGWESQPWFDEWVSRLPSKKQANPFQGAVERRRVPMDPVSVKKSLHPHPMLSSDAETLAAALAIFNSGISKDDIDLVLCSSLVPDLSVPQNASLVQHKLGLRNAGAYNVDTCCSLFITMTEIASTYVRAGMKKNVLVVGSSLLAIFFNTTMSTMRHYQFGNFDWVLFCAMFPAALLAGFIGPKIAKRLSPLVVKRVACVGLLILALRLLGMY